MSKMEDKKNPSVANLGDCKEILLDCFDGDNRAVLTLSLKKPVMIDGTKRDFAGIVIEKKQIEQLARSLMKVAKRQSRSISMAVPGQLVKPVRFA